MELEPEDENGRQGARQDNLYTYSRVKKPLSLGVGLVVVTLVRAARTQLATAALEPPTEHRLSPVTSKTWFGSGTDLAHGSVPASDAYSGGGTEGPG